MLQLLILSLLAESTSSRLVKDFVENRNDLRRQAGIPQATIDSLKKTNKHSKALFKRVVTKEKKREDESSDDDSSEDEDPLKSRRRSKYHQQERQRGLRISYYQLFVACPVAFYI
jgi:hypothetical protein